MEQERGAFKVNCASAASVPSQDWANSQSPSAVERRSGAQKDAAEILDNMSYLLMN
jgi:hypothetical protein